MARLVSERAAAAEIGLDPSQFRHLVEAGHLPQPLEICGKYDIRACHAALDRLSGLGVSAGGKLTNPLDNWKAKKGRDK